MIIGRKSLNVKIFAAFALVCACSGSARAQPAAPTVLQAQIQPARAEEASARATMVAVRMAEGETVILDGRLDEGP